MGKNNKSKGQGGVFKAVKSKSFKAKDTKNKAVNIRKVTQDNKEKIVNINKQFEEISSSLLRKVVSQPAPVPKKDEKTNRNREDICMKYKAAEEKEKEALLQLSGFKF